MAKNALARFAPRPIIIQAPRRRSYGRALRRVGRRARRLGTRKSIPIVGLAIGGGAMGYLVGSGHLDFLPEIGGSRMVTLGIAGYMANRMSNNRYIKMAGLAALSAAAFDFGRAQGGGTHGDDNWAWND
jgi:hypothetical protein